MRTKKTYSTVKYCEGAIFCSSLSRNCGVGLLTEEEIETRIEEARKVAEAQKSSEGFSKVYGVRFNDSDIIIYNPAIYMMGDALEALRNSADKLYEI